MNYSVFLSKCASEGPAVSDPDEQLQDLVAEEGNEEQDVWSRLLLSSIHSSLANGFITRLGSRRRRQHRRVYDND